MGIALSALANGTNESLGPGQLAEIDRVYRAYRHLNDDAFVEENRDRWLNG